LRIQITLEAAEEVFAAEGFQGASVEQIALRAEVAIATLYKMFESKEAIFAALVEYRQEQFLDEVRCFAEKGKSPAEQLRRLLRAVFEYFEQHKAAFRIYLTATHGFPFLMRSSLGEKTYAKYREFSAFLASILQSGMRQNAWPIDDPSRLSVVAIGGLNALLVRRHSEAHDAGLHEDVEYATSLVDRLVGVSPQRESNQRRST